MALNMYWATLFVLLPTIIVLTAGKGVAVHVLKRLVRPRAEDRDSKEYLSRKHEAKRFRYTFLRVYLLVMGAEWLQGPYLYTLLRDEKALDESTVASLYVVGYAAAAASALCAGFLADRYGRRRACLAFCLVHALSSMSVLSDSLPVLYAGRLCAGVALTLLWTVFESWMVTEFKARGLDPCCGPIAPSSASDMDDEWSDVEKKGRIGPSGGITLSSMFGIMTTSNCAAAMLGGVLGHYIVLILGSRKYPFVAALVVEAVAVFLMMRDWNENYGQEESRDADGKAEPRLRNRFGDPKVWILSYITCSFEGTNFLVLFSWPGLLHEAHNRDHGPEEADELPYGVIFATFMAAMIVGAWLFKNLVAESPTASRPSSAQLPLTILSQDELQDQQQQQYRTCLPCRRVALPSHHLLAAAVLAAGMSLLLAVCLPGEAGRYAAFLVFEVCNGVYMPCVAYQRGLVVNEANRAGMYGLMKLPLFVFVIVALCMTAEDGHHRRVVFVACCAVLVTAALGSALGLRGAQYEPVPGEGTAEEGYVAPSCCGTELEGDLEDKREP